MTELQSIAKQSYCSHMTWNADRRNQPALDFYQGLGAETIGSTNNWIHMRLSLWIVSIHINIVVDIIVRW